MTVITELSPRPGGGVEQWSLSRKRDWYDLGITVQGDNHFEYRFASLVATAEESQPPSKREGFVRRRAPKASR